MTTQTTEESEFGEGYAYCLGLFLAHDERRAKYRKYGMSASDWFNGAADHLFGLIIPDSLSDEQKKRAKDFKDECISYRLCMDHEVCTFEDASNAIQRAKDMLLEWDKINGLKAVKGSWE